MRGYEKLFAGLALGVATTLGAEALIQTVTTEYIGGTAVSDPNYCDPNRLQVDYIKTGQNTGYLVEYPYCDRGVVSVFPLLPGLPGWDHK